MPDKKKTPQPTPNEGLNPKAPRPEKDDQHLRDTGRPAHPDERERSER